MKKFFVMMMAIASLFVFVGCNSYPVPAGQVGIIVDLYGGSNGIQNQVVTVGRYTLGWNQELHLYPTYKIQYAFTQSTGEGDPDDEAVYFQNKDGVKTNGDFAVQVQVRPDADSIIKLFTTYRESVDKVVHTQVRNRLRDYINLYASSMSVEELYGPEKMVMVEKVQKALNEEFYPQGLEIITVSILGNMRFDPLVEAAITAKITATQKTLQRDNEVAQTEAEAKIKIAQARGESESNRLLAMSLTPQMVEWQRVQNEKLAIERWNGTLPTTTAGGSIPFINIK
jgi:regulator of protease activity HflC (stomatin/prohibitin superfamily)